ncbi:MAG: hypothetical protein ACJAVG_001067 [Rickettsiales bacterium]|jgi:hypothetical protein
MQFIRGSQVGFHFLHMFMQSVKRVIIVAFLVATFIGIVSLFKDSNSYIFNPILAFKYSYAKFTSSMNFEKPVIFKDIYDK